MMRGREVQRREIQKRWLALILGLFLVLIPAASWAQSSLVSLDRAYDHLYETLEESAFFIYADKGSKLNHFVPSGWMGDLKAIKLNEGSRSRPHSGKSCIQVTFKAKSSNWAGIYWQNPPNNWGTVPGAGFDLTGAARLTFWGLGSKGGEKVEFFAFGVGRDPNTGKPLPGHPHPDSSPKVSLGYVGLSRDWQQYVIDLQGRDLSYVVGGFGWTISSTQNPGGATFFLDDIRFEGNLRLPASYKALKPTDRTIKNAALVYDTALMILALLARSSDQAVQQAKALLDSLIYCQDHDRFYTDGRLRNAYRAGELVDPKTRQAQLPGWWNEQEKKWKEDRSQVGSYPGNLAWAMIALLRYYRLQGGQPYLDAAQQLGEWIFSHAYDTRGAGGYAGGYEGWEPSPARLLTKSIEQNLSVYVAFMGLYEATGEGVWHQRAMHAKGFIRAMWNPEPGFFWVGTEEDGVKLNERVLTLDSNILSLLALGEGVTYGKGLSSWAEEKFRLQDKKCLKGAKGAVSGYDFNSDKDGIFWEGTAQAVLGYQLLGNDQAKGLLEDLERVQSSAPNGNGKGIVAACRDKVTTGFAFRIINRLNVAATAWYILARQGINPYWWTGPEDPIPYEGQYE